MNHSKAKQGDTVIREGRDVFTLDLACIMPVYNEAGILDRSVRLLAGALERAVGADHFQIIIASNGCTDATDDVARKLEHELGPQVRLFVCKTKGRGLALRETVASIRARRYLYIDADLPCELSDLPRVLAPLEHGADLVVSRRHGSRPLIRRLMTWSLRQVNRLAFGLHVSDSQCAVKALSPAAAEVLARDCRQPGWYLDTELAVLARRRGLIIAEVNIHWIESRFAHRASKVRIWHDSLAFMKAAGEIRRRRSALPNRPS